MYWKRLFIVGFMAVLFALTGGTVATAATITDFVSGNPVYAPADENIVFVIRNKLDFSDITTYSTSGVSTADVVQLLDIPAGMVVTAVGLRINTATSTSSVTGVATLGDGADPNGWITAFDVGATASGVSSTYEDGISGVYQTTDGGKYYSATDTIDMVMPTLSTFDFIAQDPRSILTDFVVEAWAEGFMAPTATNYGATN